MLLKSPVNRMGGKHYLVSWLSQHIPEHVTYVEPFCGAGHLLFSKLPSPVEVLNDVDNHLIGFFRIIQNPERRQALIERLGFMPYSRVLWQDIRSQWKQGNIPQDEIERVSQWFYLNRTCFAGDMKRGGFAVPSTTGRNPVQSFRNAIEGFNTVAERLRRGVTIECLDYQECIRRYDSENTLFYCDPPYMDAEHYYGNIFTQDDHRTLANLLHDIKGQVMITHYSNEIYERLYQGWNRYEYQSFKGSHKSEGEEKPKTIEVLNCNFESVKTQGLFNGAA
mgnify:CR=1 FL=1